MRDRLLWVIVAVMLAVVIVAVVVSRAGRGDARSASFPSDGNPSALPLSSSESTAGLSTAVVRMGHLGDPDNTFWELFVRLPGQSSWSLSTPPGVADNGGLVAVPQAGGALTVGVLASGNLTFSPVARSTDHGVTWAPGELPAALAATPDALAIGTGGRLLALQSDPHQTVESSSGILSAWHPLTSAGALDGTVVDCGVSAITAVAFDRSDQPLLGVACATRGEIGVLAQRPTSTQPQRWSDVGPRLTGGAGTASVVRLERTRTGMVGLASVHSGPSPAPSSLVAFWDQGTGTTWRQSDPLPVSSTWSLRSTGVDGGGPAVSVLLGTGTRRRVERLATSSGAWIELPPAPPGTGAVATVGPETDALAVSGSHLQVWSWTAGANKWSRAQSITVPIHYGASS